MAPPSMNRANISYTFTTIDVPGATRTIIQAVNDEGDTAGVIQLPGTSGLNSLFFDEHGTTSIGPLYGSYGQHVEVTGINNRGVVIANLGGHGLYPPLGFELRSDTPHKDKQISILRLPGAAYAINNQGEIVGSGFILTKGSVTTSAAPGGTAINSSGDIAGNASESGFLYEDGSITTITYPGAIRTSVAALNDRDEVFGNYSTSATDFSNSAAFIYWHGQYTSIAVPGADITTAIDINNQGIAVGNYRDASGSHGFVDVKGGITPLDVPGAKSTIITDINNRGEIVGYFTDTSGTHGFTASPHGSATKLDFSNFQRFPAVGAIQDDPMSNINSDPTPPAVVADPTIINGTAGNDTLFGDTCDTLTGKGGNQIINGLAGNDTLYGDAYDITSFGRGGNDVLNGGDGSNTLYGDAYSMTDNTRGGNDRLNGGVGRDILYGDAYSISGDARGGNDILTARAIPLSAHLPFPVPSRLYGDAFSMSGNAQGGNDTLSGEAVSASPAAAREIALYGDAGSMIDNARGGNDTLNATTSGRNGAATLIGDASLMSGNSRGGDDRLSVTNAGVAPSIAVYGDAISMSDSVRGGNDTLSVNEPRLASSAVITLFGDAGSMSGNTHGGNDFLVATSQGKILEYGDANSLSADVVGGNDTLTVINAKGGGYPDMLFGDAFSMFGNAKAGNDILTAIDAVGGAATLLVGDAAYMDGSSRGGDDVLTGGAGNDTLYGDAMDYYGAEGGLASPSNPFQASGGNDILDGALGNDDLYGGPGNDTFVFDFNSITGVGSGNDTIHDFNKGNSSVGITAPEQDLINLSSYGFSSFSNLQSKISDNSSGNAVIQLDSNDSVTLLGVHKAELKPSDFMI